jgi:DNA sulfur modification protein DndE
MSTLIDRVKISAAGKQQLSTLKRRTGIEHYNVICRHALCLSLSNESPAPKEIISFNGGLEIDWRTFAGEAEYALTNLLIVRAIQEGNEINSGSIRQMMTLHLHRGLSYLASNSSSLI